VAIFKDIEKRLENLFEGFFNAQFRSTLQPVELARKLAAEMDRRRQIGVAHTYAPNSFRVELAEDDFAQIEGFKESLLVELTTYVSAHAREKKYRLTGAIEVTLEPDPELKTGDCEVSAHMAEERGVVDGGTQIISPEEADALRQSIRPGVLENEARGLSFTLKKRDITIGRHSDNDIVLKGPRISRRHARLERAQETYRLVDLGSTNGTSVNDTGVTTQILSDGDRVVFGDIDLVFRLL